MARRHDSRWASQVPCTGPHGTLRLPVPGRAKKGVLRTRRAATGPKAPPPEIHTPPCPCFLEGAPSPGGGRKFRRRPPPTGRPPLCGQTPPKAQRGATAVGGSTVGVRVRHFQEGAPKNSRPRERSRPRRSPAGGLRDFTRPTPRGTGLDAPRISSHGHRLLAGAGQGGGSGRRSSAAAALPLCGPSQQPCGAPSMAPLAAAAGCHTGLAYGPPGAPLTPRRERLAVPERPCPPPSAGTIGFPQRLHHGGPTVGTKASTPPLHDRHV